MCAGVSKSGSPTTRFTIDLPCRRNSLARSAAEVLGDGLMRRTRVAMRHLIYPVPDPSLPFLGVHLTRMIDGSVTVGPNAVVGFAREGYAAASFNLRDTSEMLLYGGFWKLLKTHWRSALTELRASFIRSRYLRECQKYCPELSLDDL